ncbi:MAG TPA: DUF2281 domain-containing protein [Tepidisphaeraceae bacterium]|nr:DUF2281 domain-containing protein [Tepidisphaeraceae bacterium]
MRADTRELIRTVEQLPEAKRIEVADFARFLLERNRSATPPSTPAERWLEAAPGAAVPGTVTDHIMALTRGET